MNMHEGSIMRGKKVTFESRAIFDVLQYGGKEFWWGKIIFFEISLRLPFFFFSFFFFLEFLDNIISIKRLITLTGREINASNENMIMKRR